MTKWVDVNRGSEERPDIRCQLVARDFKPKGEKDQSGILDALRPLAAKRRLFSTGGIGCAAVGRWEMTAAAVVLR